MGKIKNINGAKENMKTNRGLGKGLSALFSETEEDYGKSLLFDEEPVSKAEGVTEIGSECFSNCYEL